MDSQELGKLLDLVTPLAVEAGRAILRVYETDFEAYSKSDDSPLTEADLASHRLIIHELTKIDPMIPVLSEESKTIDYEERANWNRFWLVDPLDGTKEFIKKNGEFTVNIALIEDGKPVLGVVHAPARHTTYAGIVGEGAWLVVGQVRQPIHVRPYTGGLLEVVASRSHAGPETEELLNRLRAHVGDVELMSIGSSLKLCLVADGKAHLYPRLGPTMEWDVAAAQAVVEAAGGHVTDVHGQPLAYNKPNLLNPFFVVWAPGAPDDWRVA